MLFWLSARMLPGKSCSRAETSSGGEAIFDTEASEGLSGRSVSIWESDDTSMMHRRAVFVPIQDQTQRRTLVDKATRVFPESCMR